MMYRWLYAPIYESGSVHELQSRTKHGLRDALNTVGAILEYDYLANDRSTLFQGFINRIESFQPTHVLTQFHASDVLTVDQLRELKAAYPDIVWINWSGDSWAHSLTAPGILELAREYDLWLCAAPDVLPVYEANGIRAAFWQISFEEPTDSLPEVPAYDVVMLGNVISDKRRALFEFLRTLEGVKVGIYGDWEHSDGRCVYDFAMQRALYQNAKLAIADAAYVDAVNYTSDRPLQIMASGGAVLLHQYVPRISELIDGIWAGEHYIGWNDFESLEHTIRFMLDEAHAEARSWLPQRAKEFVYSNHAYRNRVDQLLTLLAGIQ